ncbi:hypothetical protein Mapa_007846 [Marchantia paleacea]|nr:hypothetical protein Mapa_007846 [Marchantia paleacea]
MVVMEFRRTKGLVANGRPVDGRHYSRGISFTVGRTGRALSGVSLGFFLVQRKARTGARKSVRLRTR